MATIHSFEDLKVWKKARDLCQQVFYVMYTDKFAKDWALKDQINRSSGALMDYIAEGFGRPDPRAFSQSLQLASGAALEVKSQLCRALDRNYISPTKFNTLTDMVNDIRKMLAALIAYLEKNDIREPREKDT